MSNTPPEIQLTPERAFQVNLMHRNIDGMDLQQLRAVAKEMVRLMYVREQVIVDSMKLPAPESQAFRMW